MPELDFDLSSEDEDFPQEASKKKSGGKRKKSGSAKESESKKPRSDPEYENVFTKYVTKELLTEDFRALGIVKKIKDLEVILEAINGIKATLNARSISSEFTKSIGKVPLESIFEVGQALAFKVLKGAKQKNEQPTITIDPVAVNAHLVPAAFRNALVINGSVVSIEDKGAVINIGLPKVTGFVKNEDLPPRWALEKLKIGQVLMFRVRKTADSKSQRVIDLSAFPEMDSYSNENLSLNDLMPGTIIQVEPDKAVYSGVFGTLQNGIKVYINKNYLPPRIRLDPGRFIKPIRATVICTLPNSPIFVVSAHPDIVALSKFERRSLPDEYRPGKNTKCTVYDIDKQSNIHFILGENTEKPPSLTAMTTRFHFDDFAEEFKEFKIGSTHECRIVAYRMLDRVVMVSFKKDVMEQKIVELTDAVPGEHLNAIVYEIKKNGILVKLGTKGEDGHNLLGFIPVQHILDQTNKNWKKKIEVGQRLQCRILAYNEEKKRLFLTAKPTLVNSALPIVQNIDTSLVGETVVGVSFNRFESGAFLVQFYNHVAGFLPANETKDLPNLKEGDIIKAKVVKVDMEKKRILLTLREDCEPVSLKNKKAEKAKNDNEKVVNVTKIAKSFQVKKAYVLGPWKYGKTSPFTTAELRLNGGTIGRLHVSELNLNEYADGTSPMVEFLKENTGKTVEVKVIGVGNKKSITDAGKSAIERKSGTSRFVDCTMVKSKIAEPFKKLRLINFQTSFERGNKVPIFIAEAAKMINDNCDFAKVEVNPMFFGRIPKVYINLVKNEAANNDQLSITKDSAFKFGDGELRRGLVISQEKNVRSKIVNVALGDCIIKTETNDNKTSLNSRNSKRKRVDSQVSNISDDSEIKVFETGMQDPGFDFSLGMFSMANMAKVGRSSKKTSNEEDIKDEPEGSDEEILPRKENRTTQRAAQLREAIPENQLEFDRLLTGAPNSSDLWIKYITHFLRDGNVVEARQIAERAISSVNFREEAELFNIWTAYLNLEVLFGNEESLKAVFDRAITATDSLKMHKQMAKILAHNKRDEELAELFKRMIKKFRHDDLEVWFGYAIYLYESGKFEDARNLLQKALDSLDRKNHITVLSRFAQMEYKFGDVERGKTMFEKILQTYPKRNDILNVYTSMAIKYQGSKPSESLVQEDAIN